MEVVTPGGGAAGDLVLFFPGEPGAHVDCGDLWAHDAGTDLGGFWLDWWAACDPLAVGGGQYVITDGNGGLHAILAGYNGAGPVTLTGNVSNGAAQSFGGLYPFAAGERAHCVVECDYDTGGGGAAKKLRTWVNGILDTSVAFTGTRQAGGVGSGNGPCFIGGSDHNPYRGFLEAMRLWDGTDPGTGRVAAFAPPRIYRAGSATPPNCLWEFLSGSNNRTRVDDLGLGRVSKTGGVAYQLHHGRLFGAVADVGDTVSLHTPDPFPSRPFSAENVPTWERRPATFPYGRPVGEGSSGEGSRTAGTPTGSPLVYDDFARANQTWAFQKFPTLGSTLPSGSLGIRAWALANAAHPWGILNGAAVFLGTTAYTPAVVTGGLGTANQDVRVRRRRGTGSVSDTGGVFRYQDADNFYEVHANSSGGFDTAAVVKVLAGAQTFNNLGFIGATSLTWEWLRVVASGTTVTVYVDDGAGGWTAVGSPLAGQTDLQAATGAGIVAAPNASSHARVEEFAAYAA